MKLLQTVLMLIQNYAAFCYILRGPSSGTYSTGNNITLTCIADEGDIIVWKNDQHTTIFIDDKKFTTEQKFNNFFVKYTNGVSIMFITYVQVDDEGEYYCHFSDNNFKKAYVKVEDPPKLTMFIDGKLTSGPLPLPSVSTFVIKCLAEGARPKVSIRFQVDGHEWLTPTFQNTTIRNMLFDTIATVHLNSSDNLNGSIVTCQTVGQDIIPHINESQTLYKPVCSFVTGKIETTCMCSAHPPVHKYVLSVDGVLLEGQNLTSKDQSGSTVSCLGVNAIGIGESNAIYIGNDGTPLIPFYIVFVCILVIIVLGTSIWGIRKLLGRKKKAFNVENQVVEENDASEMEPLNNRTEQVEDIHCGCFHSITKPFKQRAINEVLNAICYWICHTDSVRDDVELFLVEVLEVSPYVIQQAFDGDGSFEEKVRKILDSFLNVSDQSVTKEMLMERINTKSSICEDYRLQKASDIYRKVKVATQAVSGTKEEEIIEPSSFDNMMKICGSLIGKVAVQRLFDDQSSNLISSLKEHYGEDDTQFMSGSAFVRRLNDLQLVKDDMDLIRNFMETIERVHQYRSCKCILHYIQKVVPNDLDETIQKISKSTELQQDLETVAIDVWRIETAFVEDVVTSSKMIQDQIKILVKKWIEQNPDKATKSSLEEHSVYKGESLIAKYCNSEVSDEGTAIGKFDSQVNTCFKECLFKCGLLFGELGGSKLLEKYGLQFPNSYPEKTCSDALQILQKKNKITNESSSMAKLHQTLISVNLFRAGKIIKGYLTDSRDEFQEYKVEVTAIIGSEWDLFARDALGLEEQDVLNIINAKRIVKEQVSEVWRLWENHDESNNTKQKLIETINEKSKGFASILNLNDDHSNNITRMTSDGQQVDDSSAEDLPQQDHGIMNKLLSKMITICGGFIGIVGTKKLHRIYFPSEKESPWEAKQKSLTPGVEFLNHLIDKEKLFPTYHSFTALASTLRVYNLDRATNALRTFLDGTAYAGLPKINEDWLTFASSSINQDWEVFGSEQLGLTDNEMLGIIKVTDDYQKQARLAFEKWIEKSKLKKNVTSKQLIEVLSKSKPYDIHATNFGGTGADFKPTLTSPFSVVLLALDHLIGNEGRTRLFRSYSKTQECKRNLFEYLIQTGRLEDNQPMLTTLRKKLKECHLLRAWTRLYSYTKSRTYTNLLSNISYGMECDWELFAMKDLNLGEDEVCDITTRGKTVEAQIRIALDLWSTKNKCNEYESLFKIVVNSPVCKDTKHNSCWRKLSGDQGVNTESAEDDQHTKDRNCKRSKNSDDVFNELIQSVSVMIGNTGAFYLFQNYYDVCDQNEVKEKDDRFRKKEFDGEILIKYLIESGRLSDNTESLETFRIMLTRANLYRVRNKLDEYISQQ